MAFHISSESHSRRDHTKTSLPEQRNCSLLFTELSSTATNPVAHPIATLPEVDHKAGPISALCASRTASQNNKNKNKTASHLQFEHAHAPLESCLGAGLKSSPHHYQSTSLCLVPSVGCFGALVLISPSWYQFMAALSPFCLPSISAHRITTPPFIPHDYQRFSAYRDPDMYIFYTSD